MANVLLKYETIYDNNKTYSLNYNILTYMFGKNKHNFHFLQTMLQVLVAMFVMVGEINVFSTTFVKLPLFQAIKFLSYSMDSSCEIKKKHIKFVYPNMPTSSKPQLYNIWSSGYPKAWRGYNSFLFHRLQLRDKKKHIKFVYPNTPTSSKPQLYNIMK